MTKTLMVDYDLVSPGQKYAAIGEYLKSYGQWAKPLASTWLIRTTKSPQQVCKDLIAIVDYNDKVLVTDVTGADMSWRGLDGAVEKWIQDKYALGRAA